MFSPDLHPPPLPPLPFVSEAAAISTNNEIDRPHLFSYLGNKKPGACTGPRATTIILRDDDTRLLNVAEWGYRSAGTGRYRKSWAKSAPTSLINHRFQFFLSSQDEILLEKAGVWMKTVGQRGFQLPCNSQQMFVLFVYAYLSSARLHLILLANKHKQYANISAIERKRKTRGFGYCCTFNIERFIFCKLQ